jgi:hypothetical protein
MVKNRVWNTYLGSYNGVLNIRGMGLLDITLVILGMGDGL